jgi:hypothetical protein
MLIGIELSCVMDNAEAQESELRTNVSREEKSDLEEQMMMNVLAQSNTGRPPYATQYFSVRFYCALITLP